MFPPSVSGALAGAVFAVLLTSVCVSDVRARRIPNRLVLLIAVIGIGYSVAAEPWLPGAVRALEGIAVGLAIWLPVYLLRMMGAGDVKFFAAASAWLGPAFAVRAALLSAVLGGALALLWLVKAGWLLGFVRISSGARGSRPLTPAAAPSWKRVPYGVAMALGLAAAAWLPALF